MGRKRLDNKSVRFNFYIKKQVLDKLREKYTDAHIRILIKKFLEDLSKKY